MCPRDRVTIRRFTDKDLDRVYEIECKSFPAPWLKLEFKFVNSLRNVTFLIAEYDSLLIGYIVSMKERLPFLRHGVSGRILNLAVDSTFRRKGIGSRLLDQAVSMLCVSKVWLEVRKSNNTAKNFYLKAGFKPSGVIPFYYGGEDAVRMVKTIELSSFPPQNDDKRRC